MNARFAALLLLLFSLPGLAMDVQGHRGARGLLPENTLPGFARALELGVTTLELDVGVTRDGVVVAHHDRRLNPDVARGPDGSWVRPPGPTIRSLSFAELQRYDVGRLRPGSEYESRFKSQSPVDGARIPRLAEVLELSRTVRFNIETKLVPEAPEETLAPEPFAKAVLQEIRRAGVASRTTIQSFDFRSLAVVEREAPEIATAYLTSGRDSLPPRGKTWSPDYRDLTPALLAASRARGLRVVVWTVNAPADIARMLDAGVDGIISDYPDRVLAELKRRRGAKVE